MLSGTLCALVPSGKAVWLRIEEWNMHWPKLHFFFWLSISYAPTFLSFSLFLMQLTPRAIVVKCDGRVYDVDVEEKQRGLIPPGLQSWPLQLIEHFSHTTSVAPPPAGPAGCRPLYLLHLLDLSFTIRAPNGGCILQLRAYQSFVCNLLSTPRCKSQVPLKET